MKTRTRYRTASSLGIVSLVLVAVTVANHPIVQSLVTSLPVLSQLLPTTYVGQRFVSVLLVTCLVALGALWPLFKPRPRRILDTISLTEKRLFLAMTALATIGYFDFSYRLPRTTLVATTALLGIALPALFVIICHQPRKHTRAILVGDDPEIMIEELDAADVPIIGYVAPPNTRPTSGQALTSITDGGASTVVSEKPTQLSELPCLGGLARLSDILVEKDADTVLLAFAESDRAEFFGTIALCHEQGVAAKVHRDHADNVLLSGVMKGGDIVEINIEPWDWQDRVVKRLFDIAFAVTALLVLAPVIVVVAAAIKLDSPGPVLYSQERTAEFGETFTVYKFRSMVTDAEADTGAKLSEEDAGGVDPRVTRVGRFLRRTHLDEIPQLWSILVGDMSVVGPRPERPALDDDIEEAVEQWRQRWFVKPGLTGLAQIRGVTGHEPSEKLRCDIEYVRRQSFWFDLKVVIRQLWLVLADVVEHIGNEGDS